MGYLIWFVSEIIGKITGLTYPADLKQRYLLSAITILFFDF